LTSRSVSPSGSRVTNVLMVTTTMRMLDGVHGNTSHARPVLPLGLGLEVGGVSPEKRLVAPLSAGGHTDHSSAPSHDGLADAGGESHTRLLTIFRVANDNAGGARGTGNGATITSLCLNAGDDGAFGHGVDGQDIADLQGSFLAGIDEHAGVHALNGDEVFSALLVFVLISENNLGERSTTARIMNDVLDYAPHVALTFSVV